MEGEPGVKRSICVHRRGKEIGRGREEGIEPAGRN